MAQHEQAGKLNVRQREELRRTLHEAAEGLDWVARSVSGEDYLRECLIDVQRLTQAGMKAIQRGLDGEISDKRNEIRLLKQAVKSLSALAGDTAADFPAEVTYVFTAAPDKDAYVTKEEVLVLEDSASAADAAERLEKRLDRLGDLRDDMTRMLKQRKKTVQEATTEIVDFVHGVNSVVADVVAILI